MGESLTHHLEFRWRADGSLEAVCTLCLVYVTEPVHANDYHLIRTTQKKLRREFWWECAGRPSAAVLIGGGLLASDDPKWEQGMKGESR